MKRQPRKQKMSDAEDDARFRELYEKSRKLGLIKPKIYTPEKKRQSTRIAIA